MGIVIRLPRIHARISSTKKSGLIFSREIPVSLSTWKTRLNGTPLSPQRVTVLLSTEQSRARSTGRRPFSANKSESGVLIGGDSCTTNNDRQGNKLHKSLTTEAGGIGIVATMQKHRPKTLPLPPIEIYAKRQPQRPHYLSAWLEAKDHTRAELIEELGADKSLVSRWMDEKNPTTPGKDWAIKLGWYFAPSRDPEDFVDIFTDPTVARFQKLTRGKTVEEIDRMLNTLEAAFPAKTAKRA